MHWSLKVKLNISIRKKCETDSDERKHYTMQPFDTRIGGRLLNGGRPPTPQMAASLIARFHG